MTKNVICTSRPLAARGEDIGQRVAQVLGFRYADEEIIVRAAEQAGGEPEAVAQAEHPPGVVARVEAAGDGSRISPEIPALRA